MNQRVSFISRDREPDGEVKRGLRQRVVEAELLDRLAPADPLAGGARKDLEQLNALMGHHHLVARELNRILRQKDCVKLVDIGAGDGRFLLSLARLLGDQVPPNVSAVLVDSTQQACAATWDQFKARGWRVQSVVGDAFEWLRDQGSLQFDVILANLFLHHFVETELRALLAGIARATRLFVACEPRRSDRALAGCRLLGVIGCNHVTRHDARASVAAGFTGRELSALWPTGPDWQLVERPAGLFSHLFVARRTS